MEPLSRFPQCLCKLNSVPPKNRAGHFEPPPLKNPGEKGVYCIVGILIISCSAGPKLNFDARRVLNFAQYCVYRVSLKIYILSQSILAPGKKNQQLKNKFVIGSGAKTQLFSY